MIKRRFWPIKGRLVTCLPVHWKRKKRACSNNREKINFQKRNLLLKSINTKKISSPPNPLFLCVCVAKHVLPQTAPVHVTKYALLKKAHVAFPVCAQFNIVLEPLKVHVHRHLQSCVVKKIMCMK